MQKNCGLVKNSIYEILVYRLCQQEQVIFSPELKEFIYHGINKQNFSQPLTEITFYNICIALMKPFYANNIESAMRIFSLDTVMEIQKSNPTSLKLKEKARQVVRFALKFDDLHDRID